MTAGTNGHEPPDPERAWALEAAWGAIRSPEAASTVRAFREHYDRYASSDPELAAAVTGGMRNPEWEEATRPGVEPDPEWDPATQAQWDAEHPPEPAVNLPAEFWESRPVLRLIRQAAWSRYRCPDAVLGVVLARLAAATPPAIAIPPVVGSRASVSYYTLLCGPSGAGKSTSVALAAELLPIDTEDVSDGMPLGSGEGLVELYMGVTRDGDDVKTKVQTKRGAFVVLDEGTALVEMGGRRGATLLSTIRTMWTGAACGQANANIETRRKLEAGAYTLGLVVGIQPTKASELLADDAAGTPQRFTWLSTIDPQMPQERPQWPGGIAWTPPAPRDNRWVLSVAGEITAELEATAWAVNRGDVVLDPLDSHRDLLKLKTAALLAVLEGRLDVTVEDWQLAGVVAAASGTVRASAMDAVSFELDERERAHTRRLVAREAAQETARRHREAMRHDNLLEAAARSVVAKAKRAGREGLSRRGVRDAIGGRRRKELGGVTAVDEVLAFAADLGWVEDRGDVVFAGSGRPS